MALGKFPEAIYDFTWALKISIDKNKDDEKIAAYNRFAGNCYFEMSQYNEALQHYKQAQQKEESITTNDGPRQANS